MVSRSGDEVEVREGFSICKIQKMIKLRRQKLINPLIEFGYRYLDGQTL